MSKKRYAIVGAGHRAVMFFKAITQQYAETCELVGLCDSNQARMDYYNGRLRSDGKAAVATFKAERFDEMIRQTRPDVVIVTTRDCDHHRYIIRAMELGCDVITEKPMTTDEFKCQALLDAIQRTGRRCTVSFNARYGPADCKVKELLAGGVIGKVHSVSYEHLLDTRHGADYFRRWHRDKANSGGLMVHKCTHCFDLVNWWLDACPQTVFASGGVKFYGPQRGPDGQPLPHGQRCRTCTLTATCKFYFDVTARPAYAGLYSPPAEAEDGYFRDQCVFGEGISTEDSVAAIVSYDSGAILSYQLTAFAPYEGSRVVFNGQTGRLEFIGVHDTQWLAQDVEGSGATGPRKPAGTTIEVFPQFAPACRVEWEQVRGGHGGADKRIVADLFGPGLGLSLDQQADHFDGARSALVGIAANRSMETGRVIRIDELVALPARTRPGQPHTGNRTT